MVGLFVMNNSDMREKLTSLVGVPSHSDHRPTVFC